MKIDSDRSGQNGRLLISNALKGTIAAQAIAILATPLMTRLYGPSAIGEYFTILSICLILSSIANLRLDVAVQRVESVLVPATLGSAMLISLAVSSLIGLIGLIAQPYFPHLPYLGQLLFSYCLVLSTQQIITALLLRGERHTFLSINRAAINGFIVLLQLGGSYLGTDARILLFTDLTARLLVLIIIFPHAFKIVGPPVFIWSAIKNTIVREINLIRFSTPATLLNNAAIYALPVALAFSYSSYLVGQIAITQKLVGLPLAVIGQAVGQVYLANAIKNIDKSSKIRHLHFIKTVRTLALMSLFLLAFIPFAPMTFKLFLGEDWIQAGAFYQILALSYAAQFIANPVSQTLNLHSAERLQFLWDAARFAAIGLVLLLGPAIGLDITTIIIIYTAVMASSYVTLLILSSHAVRREKKALA